MKPKALLLLAIVLSTGRIIFAQEKDTAMHIICFCESDAEFPGGVLAFERYIHDSIRYPKRMAEIGLTSKCFVRFRILTDGTVDKIEILRGVTDCPECDREILRLLRTMPRWIPATQAGIPVEACFDVPFSFRME